MTNVDHPAHGAPATGTPMLVIVFFLLFAGVVLWAFGRILAGFFTPVVLGGIVVVFTYPVYQRLLRRWPSRPALCAGLTLLGVAMLVFLPAGILFAMIVGQAHALFDVLQGVDVAKALDAVEVPAFLSHFVPQDVAAKFDLRATIFEIVKRLPGLVATQGGALLAGAANIVVNFFFMLFAMYFFYTEGSRLVDLLRSLSPLPSRYNDEVVSKLKSVINATFRGHFLTAIAQGLATGIGLAIAGIPGAVFWGSVAALLALIPLLGAALVWFPAATWLAVQAARGEEAWGWALFMFMWGALVVSLVDNIIRPWAMKGGTDTSAVVLLFSVIGGMRAFGFLGLIIGPIVFALLVTVVQIYRAMLLHSQEPAASPPPAEQSAAAEATG